MKNPKKILITGAGSGIGKALAIFYAKSAIRGDAQLKLFLCGRNLIKLEETKKLCQELGAEVSIEILDVKNQQDCRLWIEKIAENCQLDLVIANAGISAGTAGGSESFTQISEIFATNLNGVLNIIHPAIERMKVNASGQIAVISSLAGFRGLPSSPAYSASKAAVRVYGEALRGNLAQFGIKVSVICPGYVITPMTAVNKFFMPFIMPVEKAVAIIAAGLAKNQSRIAFPGPLYFIIWLLTLLPTSLTDKILAKLPSKSKLPESGNIKTT